MKKLLISILSILLITRVLAANPPATATPASIKLGEDYTLISTPVNKTAEPRGVVNVKEFFSFTCIHCKLTEPLVEQNLVNNKNIHLQKIQVVWGNNPIINGYAKLSATIEQQNMNQLNVPIFNKIFSQADMNNPAKANDLNNQDTLSAFLIQSGLTKAQAVQFMSIYNSFTVVSQVQQFKRLTSLYNITGTPTFVVGDKYIVSPAQPARLIQVVQFLVNKVNTENSKAK